MIEFQSAHPVRGATFFGFRILPAPLFQSTRPVWGATLARSVASIALIISIHAPRVGRDSFCTTTTCRRTDFNPRAPCGARRLEKQRARRMGRFQSTRPVWGATRCFARRRDCVLFQSTRPVWGATAATYPRTGILIISIHAPRVGRDTFRQHEIPWKQSISIHAPRVGRDRITPSSAPASRNFNPRAPCGARPTVAPVASRAVDFNPRAPCGARPGSPARCQKRSYFNPRAPCGARLRERADRGGAVRFQSTRPVWGATPRTSFASASPQFQSTRPVWGATWREHSAERCDGISIHAPRVGRDMKQPTGQRDAAEISIHAPRVGRDHALENDFGPIRISIHAPRVGRDASATILLNFIVDFNPRAPCGARRLMLSNVVVWWYFNPRAPCGARPDVV